MLHRAKLILTPWLCHFQDSVVRSFFFFACLVCKWSSCIVNVDLIFVALTTWPYPCSIALVIACNQYLDAHLLALQNSFSFSYKALSCLINFNSMTLPFPNSVFRSFFFFACLVCKWSSCIVYVDLIFVALTTWPYPCSFALVIACNQYLDAHLHALQNSFSSSYNASSC